MAAEGNKLLTVGKDLQLLLLAAVVQEFMRGDFGETFIRPD